jgi:hypothetical protein
MCHEPAALCAAASRVPQAGAFAIGSGQFGDHHHADAVARARRALHQGCGRVRPVSADRDGRRRTGSTLWEVIEEARLSPEKPMRGIDTEVSVW